MAALTRLSAARTATLTPTTRHTKMPNRRQRHPCCRSSPRRLPLPRFPTPRLCEGWSATTAINRRTTVHLMPMTRRRPSSTTLRWAPRWMSRAIGVRPCKDSGSARGETPSCRTFGQSCSARNSPPPRTGQRRLSWRRPQRRPRRIGWQWRRSCGDCAPMTRRAAQRGETRTTGPRRNQCTRHRAPTAAQRLLPPLQRKKPRRTTTLQRRA